MTESGSRKTAKEILTPPTPEQALQWQDCPEVLKWIHTSTDVRELDDFILNASIQSLSHQRALSKRQQLQFEALSKPHWTVTPVFCLTLISAVAAIAACVIAWFAWRRPISPEPSSPALSTGNSESSPQPAPAQLPK